MGRSIRNTLTGAAALAALALPSVAADAATRANVGLNQSLRMSVGGSAASVVVSNPAIADVTVVDSHSVIVIGKGYGTTQIMVMDSTGRVLLDSVVTVSAPLEGQMTLFRGVTGQQYNCTPRCELDSSSKAAAAPAPSS